MEGIKVRLLPYEVADGPANMAADDVLLEFAQAEHVASLRFYGWLPATLSLGYFQPAADRFKVKSPELGSLPWVRRATGGSALVHDKEVTYALALPPGPPWQTGESWLVRMHRIIADALANLGVAAPMTIADEPQVLGDVLCFQKHTAGDLICRGAKIAGSAQRKHRQCLLQHGGILLAQSRHTPQLPGLAELSGLTIMEDQIVAAVKTAFVKETGWELLHADWSEAEQERRRLAFGKYRSPIWNERR